MRSEHLIYFGYQKDTNIKVFDYKITFFISQHTPTSLIDILNQNKVLKASFKDLCYMYKYISDYIWYDKFN